MTYHPLTSDTGQTPARRSEEAHDILFKHRLIDHMESMTAKQREFVEEMAVEFDLDPEHPISPKQLLWLRDLKEQHVD